MRSARFSVRKLCFECIPGVDGPLDQRSIPQHSLEVVEEVESLFDHDESDDRAPVTMEHEVNWREN